MNHKLINVTDSELILLGEGELNSSEQQDLIRRLDEHPQQWRACALALLESRAIEKSFHALTGSESTFSTNAFAEDALIEKPTAKLNSLPRNRKQPWLLAASLAIALTVGALLGNQWAEPTSSVSAKIDSAKSTEVAHSELTADVENILGRLKVGDELLLAVVQLEHQGKQMNVPILESPRMAEEFRRLPVPRIPANGIRQANRAGWNITQQRQLLAIETPGSEVKLMPVGLWNLKPVGRDVL